MEIIETRLTLDDFILEINKVPSFELKLAQLQDWVARLDLEDLAIAKHIYFSPENYQRRIIYRDSSCEIILVCWQPGQFSSIHDHGDSLNVTRVYQGVLTFTKAYLLLSTPKKGCFWETTAVSEIRQQAQTLAQQLVALEIKNKSLTQI